MLDADFEMIKAELGLLRATGQIETVVRGGSSAHNRHAAQKPQHRNRSPYARFRRVDSALLELFQEEYRALRPRAPIPPFQVRFRRFTGLNTTIRLREGAIKVHLSDLLEGAPEPVLRAIAHILLAKLYRKPIEAAHAGRYRRFASSEAMVRQTERIRQSRGRKKISSAQGETYDLDEVFESLNTRVSFTDCSAARCSPGANTSPNAASATTTPPTTRSWSAKSSTARRRRVTPSNT